MGQTKGFAAGVLIVRQVDKPCEKLLVSKAETYTAPIQGFRMGTI